MSAQNETSDMRSWQRTLWIGVASALGLVGLLLVLLVSSTVSRTNDLLAAYGGADLTFAFAGMALVNLTLLRLLAILIGAGMVFGGLAVSFFTHEATTRLTAGHSEQSLGLKASLATSSPGIAAIVVGAAVILSALFAQGRHTYVAPNLIPYMQPDNSPTSVAEGSEGQSSVPSAGGAASSAEQQFPSAAEILKKSTKEDKK
jgi:hypothetical protein